MNSLKTLLGATLLAALAYGVYVGITKKPGAETAQVVGPKIDPGKPISFPKATVTPVDATSAEAPPFDAGQAETTAAPPFAETAKNAWEQETTDSTAAAAPMDDPPLPAVAEAPIENQQYGPPTDTAAPLDPGAAENVALATPGAALPGVAPAAENHFQTKMVAIEQQLMAGQLAEAHLELSKFYGESSLTPEEHQRVVDLLSQLAGTVVYSREHLLAPPHIVAPGETLEQIAATCNVPWQLLAKINGLPGPGPLQPGQQLKVMNGPFHAYIDLEDRQLALFLDGKYYAGRFPVAFGKEVEPQPGPYIYTVKNKLEGPTYYGQQATPTGKQESYGPGEPQNPLGSRKIELDRQLSIHGTNDPASLDRDDPRGCIRLAPTDAEDVYDILTIGSQVVIQR